MLIVFKASFNQAAKRSETIQNPLVPGIQTLHHIILSLALHRGGVPEGSSCHHFDLIRYGVREASHPVISTTAARSRRDQEEQTEYSINTYNTITYATSCRN